MSSPTEVVPRTHFAEISSRTLGSLVYVNPSADSDRRAMGWYFSMHIGTWAGFSDPLTEQAAHAESTGGMPALYHS
jgi:hypothetical protein